MKQQIENVSYHGIPLAKVEVHIMGITLKDDGISAQTYHKVSNVRMIEGEEVIEALGTFNHPFEYEDSVSLQTGMDAVLAYLADPTT